MLVAEAVEAVAPAGQALRQLANLQTVMTQGVTAARRLFAALDVVADIRDVEGAQRVTASDGAIAFDNVSFAYAEGDSTLDGVSLTVNEVEQRTHSFGVNIIPHTLSATTFGDATKGVIVNLEVDLLARYVARLAKS